MEEEYNWSLILKVAVPVSLIEAYIFYTGISDSWKWFLLITGIAVAFAISYKMGKKKNNLFTAVGIVILVALVVRFLKNFGFF